MRGPLLEKESPHIPSHCGHEIWWTSFETLASLKDLRHLYIRIYFKYEFSKQIRAQKAARGREVPPQPPRARLFSSPNRVQRGLVN